MGTAAITVGDRFVQYGGKSYSLAISGNKELVLTVSGGKTIVQDSEVVTAGGSATLTPDAIYTCPAKLGNGGVVENNGGTVTGSDVIFKGNTTYGAWASGGALYNYNGTISLSGDANFTGNRVTHYGGAIYNGSTSGGATFNFTGSTASVSFSANTSSSGIGGAIYV